MTEELDLIRKIVWSYVKTNPGLEYDDLFSEACIAYLETINDYDPTKSRKSTYIWNVLHNHLNNFINIENRRRHYEYSADPSEIEPLLSHRSSPGPEHYILVKEAWNEIHDALSPEAKVICDMAINRADLYLPLDKPKFCRGIIVRALRQLGWSWTAIWDAFREIKSLLCQKPGEEILKC